MNRLDAAIAKLSSGLDRLEARVEEAAERARRTAALESELALLKDERERLLARITVLE